MSAYDELQNKTESIFTDLEMCVLYCGDKQEYDVNYINALLAATELVDKNKELAALRERVGKLEEEKERTRETVKMARQKLQSTQINWQEDCLFQCNDLLGIALDVCPSCTWRGDVSLQDGTCPYCQTNWYALRGEA